MAGTLQGRDEVTIAAPISTVWSLISDSSRLPEWGPPVRSVTVLGRPEQVGVRRRIDAEFDGKAGHFVEVRTEHEEGRKIAYLIEEETFGLFKVMTSRASRSSSTRWARARRAWSSRSFTSRKGSWVLC